MIRWIISL